MWAIMAFDVSLYQMVTLYETPFEWFGWASLLFLTEMPILSLLGWKLKNCIEYHEVDWTSQTREVSIDEFTRMIKSYKAGYRHIIAIFDSRLSILAIACVLGALFLPFPLTRSTLLIISLTPAIIAGILMLFGILFAYFIFELSPNSASSEFSSYNPRIFNHAVFLLSHLPGIFWSGVRMVIEEASGFYRIKEPYPVARIEGIEGVARLDCTIDERGVIRDMKAIFESEPSKESKIIDEIRAPIADTDIVQLIKKIINVYTTERGGEELLEDILEEINVYLNRHGQAKKKKDSNDCLISSEDKGHLAEEST
jgi:hypothetical protein